DYSFALFCSSLRSHRLRCLRKRIVILSLVQRRTHWVQPNGKSIRMQVGIGRVRTPAVLADSLTLNISVYEAEGTSPRASNWAETGTGPITSNRTNRIPARLWLVHLASLKVLSGQICGKLNTHTTSRSGVILVQPQFGPTLSEALAESR